MPRFPAPSELLSRATLVAASLLPPSAAHGFDTGHHLDLTRAVLSERSFEEQAIRSCQIANWLTDYYSTSPTAPAEVEEELRKLHCDNLYSTKEATWYWGRLAVNLQGACRQAAADEAPLDLLTAMGVALHAAQDFYSHSNWAETHTRAPGGPYRTETWFSAGAPANAEIVTGKYRPYPSPPPAGVPEHGGYQSGLNKDSQVRPRWDEAYVFAYCACHELVAAAEAWCEAERPGFWRAARQLTLSAADRTALAADLGAARDLSMWISASGADGHYKGNLSGNTAAFLTAATRWTAAADSRFVRLFKRRRLHQRISDQLYGGPPPAPPSIPSFDEDRLVVTVRVTRVAETDDLTLLEPRIDVGGKPDFYAVLHAGGQRYRERVAQDRDSVTDPWHLIHFAQADEGQVPILINVWDEDTGAAGGDDHCDINPAGGRRPLSVRLNTADNSLSGDIQGRHATAATAFESAGRRPDSDRAVIRAWIRSDPLGAD